MFKYGTGNLTADPEVARTDNSVKVSFAVGHTPRFRDKTGEFRDSDSVFARIEWWGREAEAFAKEARKGTPVVFFGDERSSTWETEDGEERRRQFIKAERVGIVQRAAKPDASGEGVATEAEDDE